MGSWIRCGVSAGIEFRASGEGFRDLGLFLQGFVVLLIYNILNCKIPPNCVPGIFLAATGNSSLCPSSICTASSQHWA